MAGSETAQGGGVGAVDPGARSWALGREAKQQGCLAFPVLSWSSSRASGSRVPARTEVQQFDGTLALTAWRQRWAPTTWAPRLLTDRLETVLEQSTEHRTQLTLRLLARNCDWAAGVLLRGPPPSPARSLPPPASCSFPLPPTPPAQAGPQQAAQTGVSLHCWT